MSIFLHACMHVCLCRHVFMYITCVPTYPRDQKNALHLLKLVLQMILVGAGNGAHVVVCVNSNCSSHLCNPLGLISNLDMLSFLRVAYF